MPLGLWLAAALTATRLSPEAQALVASVQAAIDTEKARQAALPPPKDDAERLARLGALDWAPRAVITTFDFARLPPDERDLASRAAGVRIEAQDRADAAVMLRLLPPEGWFLRSRYGARASEAAFHIVQHGPTGLQRRFLPVIGPLVAKGEIDGELYAKMFDRVAISDGRPQRYGTQFRCDGGKMRPYPIEDSAHLEDRRRTMGIDVTFEAMLAVAHAQPTCAQTPLPPPPGMKLD